MEFFFTVCLLGGWGEDATVGGGWKYPGPHGGIYAPFALLIFTFIFAFLLFYI